jgi:dTDP-4-dehydrorhamnose reductase
VPVAPLKWLIVGGGGMLATDLLSELRALDEPVVTFSQADLDITDAAAVSRAITAAVPDVIVNCAAYTQVDRAEEDAALANAVNGSAVEHLASAADKAGALLVQISTDFVFDGTSRVPYEVTDAPAPLSVYGSSKLLGEQAASRAAKYLVIRTSWLFGVNGNNFVEAIRNQVRKGASPLRVVDDQRGRPTYTPHLAKAILRLSRLAHDSADARGIAHYADGPDCTWFDFARAIVEECGGGVDVVPVPTSAFPRPAARPQYSVLSTERYERLTGVAAASWRDGLREYFALRP